LEANLIAISIPIPLITLGWIALSALIGLLALAQGRSFVSWSLASAMATPLVGLLLFILPKPSQTKQPTPTNKPVVPPRIPAPQLQGSLPMKTIRALAYRVESSRLIGSISRRKAAAYRSLENFTAATEIDKGIAAAVRDEFPNKPTDR
jgi:lysozyme family protein